MAPRVLTKATTLTIISYKIEPYFLGLQFWFTRFTSKDANIDVVAMVTEHLKSGNKYCRRIDLNSLTCRLSFCEFFFKLCACYLAEMLRQTFWKDRIVQTVFPVSRNFVH